MKKIISFLFLLCMAITIGCSHLGWTNADRNKLINTCMDEAKKRSAYLNDSTLKKYCNCYQQNLEQKYPDQSALAKAPKEEVLKSAADCVQSLIK